MKNKYLQEVKTKCTFPGICWRRFCDGNGIVIHCQLVTSGNVGHYTYFTLVVQTIAVPQGPKLHVGLSVLLSAELADTFTDLREVHLCRS
jgi:hypothetical protein